MLEKQEVFCHQSLLPSQGAQYVFCACAALTTPARRGNYLLALRRAPAFIPKHWDFKEKGFFFKCLCKGKMTWIHAHPAQPQQWPGLLLPPAGS